MSQPSSPLKDLATIWRGSQAPTMEEMSASRARLYTAAVHEICTRSQSREFYYDPLADPIFLWCSQWLQVADGSRPRIDAGVENNFRLKMDPIPLSNKILSADTHAFDDLVDEPAA